MTAVPCSSVIPSGQRLTLPDGINTLRPRQNGRHFPDDIFMCIFVNENIWLSLKVSLKFVPEVRINNIPALVYIMAWRRPGDKPLSEPMMVRLPTHICVTRSQWVNASRRYQSEEGCIIDPYIVKTSVTFWLLEKKNNESQPNCMFTPRLHFDTVNLLWHVQTFVTTIFLRCEEISTWSIAVRVTDILSSSIIIPLVTPFQHHFINT